ncbi:H-NS family nucleoid-associated regulatory protein [Paraburkholderia sp. GAS32]|uniref:H-NS histone family protein n=1 Tax=Paraburkholderia sp. GAS32 TaxID=3035129 RepID=UPI003D1E9C57
MEWAKSNNERTPRGEARYRDPANNFNTWSGRGRRPAWLLAYINQGRSLEDFKIPRPRKARSQG